MKISKSELNLFGLSILIAVVAMSILFSLVTAAIFLGGFAENVPTAVIHGMNAILLLSLAIVIFAVVVLPEEISAYVVWQTGIIIASISLARLFMFGFDIWDIFFLGGGLFLPTALAEVPQLTPFSKLPGKKTNWRDTLVLASCSLVIAFLNWLVIKFCLIHWLEGVLG